jgi:transitional endoplasmic reticulum ATPase
MGDAKMNISDAEILEEVESFDQEDKATKARQRKAKEQREIAETEIVRTEQQQIIVPVGMSLSKAIKTLYEKKKQEETQVAVREVVDAWPMDGAVAFQYVLEEKYGFVNQVAIPGFFGPTPPYQVGIRINSKGDTMQCNWGRMELSVLDHGFLETGFCEENGNLKFVIGGEVKKKFLDEVADIARRTRERVRQASIYKGKAIRLDFRDEDGERKEFHITDSPEFIGIDPNKLDDVVYPEHVQGVVDMALFNPIKYPDACRKMGIPLKRGALLEGPYGTGKTLTAYQMAAHGTNNGWTFVYLMDVRDLDLAMRFAMHYAPSIVFAEDIDQVARMGMRDKAEVNRLTTILDGVDSKDQEIFVVFTTNFKKMIDGVFIRPGRIDAVVTLTPPDRGAAIKLVRKYGINATGASVLHPDITDQEIGDSLQCMIEYQANAAFYREVVERSKLAAVPEFSKTGLISITAANLNAGAHSMIPHLEFQRDQSPDADGRHSVGEDAMAAAMAAMMAPPPNVVKKMMKAMRRRQSSGL